MSRPGTPDNSGLTPILGPLAQEEVTHIFGRRSDLTYRKIDHVEVNGVDLYMSILTGSLIRESTFDNVLFHRSDLDGIRAEKCVFRDCDFSNCDIRSSVFAECVFERCSFDGALIDDCQGQACQFNDSSLEGVSLAHCNFHQSTFKASKISRASLLHNKLYECEVIDVNVGDCTILYTIVRDCRLTAITISGECIGGIFGITRDQLEDMSISYLGEDEAVPPESDLLALIYEQYVRRRWSIGQLVFNLNFNLVSVLAAFDAYLSISFNRFVEFGFVKGDELEFIADLMEELALQERLPLLSAINVLDWCSALEAAIKESDSGASENSGDPFRTFVSRVVLLTNRLLDRLDVALPQIPIDKSNQPFCIEATFLEKPVVTIPELLNSIKTPSLSGDSASSQLLASRSGSYVEVVLTTLSSVVALQVLLYLINGCVIQLTELKERMRALTRKRAPKSYVQLALSNTQHASPIVLSVLPGLLAYVKGLGWLKQPALGGFAASNITALREVDCGPESKAGN